VDQPQSLARFFSKIAFTSLLFRKDEIEAMKGQFKKLSLAKSQKVL